MMGLLVSESSSGCMRLTLDRPERANAIDGTLIGQLLAALQRAVVSNVRLVVLDGAGRNFCGGFDFSGLDQCSDGDLLLRFVRIEQVLQLLWNGPFVSVALVHGAAYGAGADLVTASTYRVGEAGCRFRFPGYRFGIALGSRRLGRVIGEQSARDILLANSVVDTEQAHECGLLSHVAPRSEWGGFISRVQEQITSLTADSLAGLLRNVRSDPDADARDLAALVRSAAEPNLRERIHVYQTSAIGGH